MEMNGEQTIKKGQKTSKSIILGYIICIIAIIVAAFWATYKEEKETPEAIDFTTNGAIGLDLDKYAYLDVQGLTSEVAIYGDVENEKSSDNDRYYIVFNNGYMYIADLDFDTIDLLKPWQDYIYSEEENPAMPEPKKIYGMTETIPNELRQKVLEYYNEGLSEEYQISEEKFEDYFGDVLLNVRRKPVDTMIQTLIIILAIIALFVLLIVHISSIIEKNVVRKYLKRNDYEEELAHQLDDFIEEKHYNDKVILTRDFFVDLKNGRFVAFKYDDVKWIHIHNIRTYGVIATSSLIVYLRDGKTRLTCLQIFGKTTDEFMQIFNEICEKTPADTLKGYTVENRDAYKKYKKEL